MIKKTLCKERSLYEKKQKTLPKFKNEVEIDFSELKPSTKTITLRLPESLLAALKKLAHQKDVPYQSLMKIFLAERVKKEYEAT